jgi:hypothetical protein
LKVIFNPENSNDRKSLVEKIFQVMGVDNLNFYCVIETSSDADIGLISGSRDYGIYFPNHSKNELLTEVLSPQIFNLLNGDSEPHVIWLSSRAYQMNEIKFSWVVSHELGHLLQAVGLRPQLNQLHNLVLNLRKEPEFKSLQATLMQHTEIDSDLLALKTCQNIFGLAEIESYLLEDGIERYPCPEYVKFLSEVNSRMAQ